MTGPEPALPGGDAFTTLALPFTSEVPCRVRPGPRPDSPLVVLCHGMGEDPARASAGWPEVAALPAHLVVPSGPYPFEIRSGAGIRIGHAWYLYDGGPGRFRETVDRSAAWLAAALEGIERDREWAPSGRALVGHSQGAYFGYLLALRRQDLFDRLVAVAGRLKEEFAAEPLAGPGRLRTLIVHGEADRAVPPDAARRSEAALRRAGYAVELRLLPGGHRLSPDRDAAAARWLAAAWNLPSSPALHPPASPRRSVVFSAATEDKPAMIDYINTDPLKVGMRVKVQHKFSRDLDPSRPGGPIESQYLYLPGTVIESRKIHGRQEFKVKLEQPHPAGQEWFWLGVVFPEGKEPR